MQADLENVLDTAPAHGVSREASDRLDDHVVAAYDRIERSRVASEHGYGSPDLPDTTDPAVIHDAVSQLDNSSTAITVGIGGNALGAVTLTDTLKSNMGAYYLDNVNPEVIEYPFDSLDLTSTIVNAVS